MRSARKMISAFLPGLAMAVLILDAKTALAGAQSGLELCIRVVIPSLFPFLFLSVMATGSLVGRKVSVLRPLGKLCRIPEGSEGLLAVGLLGGYPVGAQCVSQACRDGTLSKATAHRMLGFCSNAGPSFIFGMLSGIFEPVALWSLWGIHILSAILTGILLPGGSSNTLGMISKPAPTMPQALEHSIRVMGNICGWVIIFRVLLSFFQRWFLWLFPEDAAILISGLLELTNGCCRLSTASSSGMRFLLTSVMLGFGGVCVGLQTVSVTGVLGTGLYFPGKLIQSVVSLVLAWIVVPLLFPQESAIPLHPAVIVCSLLAVIPVITAKNSKNRSSNLAQQGV